VNASCARPGLARSEWADVRRMMDHLDFPVPDPVLKENPFEGLPRIRGGVREVSRQTIPRYAVRML